MKLRGRKTERAFSYVTLIPYLLIIHWLVLGSLISTDRHYEVMSLSKSVEQGPWEARSRSVVGEFPRPSWSPKSQYCAHQSATVVRFLVHMILLHIRTVFFFKILFNIILQCMREIRYGSNLINVDSGRFRTKLIHVRKFQSKRNLFKKLLSYLSLVNDSESATL